MLETLRRLVPILILSCGVLRAESSLIFPRFSALDLTGIAVVNPTEQEAPVRFTAYAPSGSLLQAQGFSNPVDITIAAGEQFARVTIDPTFFGGGLNIEEMGWIEASSPVDGLTGFFLHLNPAITFFDGADLPPASPEISFQEVRLDADFTTELNLVNPNSAETSVRLTLQAMDAGRVREIQIPARGSIQLDAAGFFELGAQPAGFQVAEPVYISVLADLPVAGFAFVREGAKDLLGVNARPVSERLNQLFFPQLAVLGGIRTELVLSNQGAEQALLSIAARQPDGSLFGPDRLTRNPVDRALLPGAVLREDMESLFGFFGPNSLEGWVEVTSSSRGINGTISYSIGASGSQAAVTSLVGGRTSAIFSHVATDSGFFTGVAVLNAARLATDIRILAMQPDGTILGVFNAGLEPGQRLTALLSQIIPEAAGQPGGLIFVRSSVPVYLSSIFGARGVLANIPPQAVPPTYQPDKDQPQLRITPPLANVEPGGTQLYELQGSLGDVVWSVNGIPEGDGTVGRIAGGEYTAPDPPPVRQPVTISAATGGLRASATADVLRSEMLRTGLATVQSTAFLEGLGRVFTAELTAAGPGTQQVGSSPLVGSVIRDVTGGEAAEVRFFPGEDIPKIIPFQGVDGRAYLLIAGRSSGNIVRLDPLTGEILNLATGLKEPTSLVLDELSGNLLVAEADRITTVSRNRLNQGLVSQAFFSVGAADHLRAGRLLGVAPRGIEIDRCSGDIYFSDAELGAVQRIRYESGVREIVTPLDRPGQMQAIYRKGVSCPDSFQLVVVREDSDVLALLIPSQNRVLDWVTAPGANDVAFAAGDGEVFAVSGLLVGSATQETGEVSVVSLAELYDETAANPPVELEADERRVRDRTACGPVSFTDPALEVAVRDSLQVGGDEEITCLQAATIKELDLGEAGIESLDGLEFLVGLEILSFPDNAVVSLAPLTNLVQLREVSAASNQIGNLPTSASLSGTFNSPLPLRLGTVPDDSLIPLQNLVHLELLDLTQNRIRDIRWLGGLNQLTEVLLGGNLIEDIDPLIETTGLGTGDHLALTDNPLSESSCERTAQLLSRGVELNLAFTPCALPLRFPPDSVNRLVAGEAADSHFDDLFSTRGAGTSSGIETTLVGTATASILSRLTRVYGAGEYVIHSAILTVGDESDEYLATGNANSATVVTPYDPADVTFNNFNQGGEPLQDFCVLGSAPIEEPFSTGWDFTSVFQSYLEGGVNQGLYFRDPDADISGSRTTSRSNLHWDVEAVVNSGPRPQPACVSQPGRVCVIGEGIALPGATLNGVDLTGEFFSLAISLLATSPNVSGSSDFGLFQIPGRMVITFSDNLEPPNATEVTLERDTFGLGLQQFRTEGDAPSDRFSIFGITRDGGSVGGMGFVFEPGTIPEVTELVADFPGTQTLPFDFCLGRAGFFISARLDTQEFGPASLTLGDSQNGIPLASGVTLRILP